MGYSPRSEDVYKKTIGASIARGDSMRYSRSIESGATEAKAHPNLDPKGLNKAGKQIRECLDSALHPNATPIIVSFDLTGSNAQVARLSQVKLNTLFGVLQRRGICPDPAVAIVGYGDAYCDSVPLQFGQFESGNEIDISLDNVYMEQGGGANAGETATLAWYFANRFCVTDSFDKRGKKGYYMMIADERALELKPSHIEKFIGEDVQLSAEHLTPEYLADKLKEKWTVFVLQVNNETAKKQKARDQYVKLFGEQHVIDLTDPENMIEVICAAIGAVEETLDADDAVDILVDSGASKAAATTALAAVSGLFKTDGSGKGGELAVVAPNLDL